MNNIEIEPIYPLTQAQYDELRTVQTEPDQLLRETNKTLTTKLEEAERKLKEGSFENARLDSPIMVNDEVLAPRSITDFVTMFNSLVHYHRPATIKDADRIVYEYTEQLASTFLYDNFFKSQAELKRYRTGIVKKGLYAMKAKQMVKQ